MYSEWGSCLHDSLRILRESMSTLVTFFIIAIVFCVLLCVIISVKDIKSRQPLDKKIMAHFFIFLVLLIAFSLGWIVGCVYLFSPIPLASAIAFFIFLSLKLATVLLFSLDQYLVKWQERYSPNYSQISTEFINKKPIH